MHKTIINDLIAKSKGLFILLLVLAVSMSAYAQDGKAIFDANCKMCHAINDVVIDRH